jgi:hypothetical protein
VSYLRKAAVGVVAMLLATGYQYVRFLQTERSLLEKHGHYLAEMLAYNCKYGVLMKDTALLRQLAQSFQDVEGPQRIVLRDAAGAVLAEHGAPLPEADALVLSVPITSTGVTEQPQEPSVPNSPVRTIGSAEVSMSTARVREDALRLSLQGGSVFLATFLVGLAVMRRF